MNLVTRLFGFGASFNDANAAELVKIQSGQLYLSRPGNIRSSRECIYNEAMATVRRAPSVEHNFQLVITRVFEEGEEDILEEEDENEDKVFLVGEELEFRTGILDGEPTLVWRDLDGDVDETYEFVATGTNKATVDFFVQCMYKAMYERKYRVSSDRASDRDLLEFVWQDPGTSSRNDAEQQSTKPLSHDDAANVGAMDKLKSTSGPASPSAIPSVISAHAELYLWDQDDGHFLKQADVDAKIVEKQSSNFEYYITASVAGTRQQLLAHKLRSELNARWSTKLGSLTWNHTSEKGLISSWCFKFEDQEGFQAFQEAFGKCLYQHLNAMSWEKTKAEDQAYVLSSYSEDVEMQDADNEEDEDAVESALGEESEEEDESDGNEGPAAPASDDRNSQLTVGYKNDRTFVTRGDKIGVFKHGDSGKLEYAATIKDLGFKKMKSFRPKNMMLHDEDSKLILMNPNERHSLFAMDIEYGKVVEEWKVHDDITVDYIAPSDKFAQMTGEQTLVGTSHNALFRIDPRVGGGSGGDGAMVERKQYTTKSRFSGVTTTAKGQLAVASEKGDIRLFDSVGKIAKTALPPMGDPIVGVDVTADGRWIVATCKSYLLLIDTLIGEGKYSGSLGFDRSFPANAKPQPKRLQLRSEHVAYMGQDISFTAARFNLVEGQEENAIVTSTGRYVVAWDFAKVKKGKVDSYVIKKYEDDVVQDNFKFGDDKEIIVALSNDVLALNKKNLKKLPRGSLTTTPSKLKSRSSVVNSPY
ncbi:VID27-domain-containing protein [Rickenella mellea]|uniref:VID27-domain-containing protein n=1 Tax=Rickenella mellea TaxID=50990 RepID=A0A4V3AZL4_9AGAM|nr:VID27-domain-containing protein [Rickenella mellea]